MWRKTVSFVLALTLVFSASDLSFLSFAEENKSLAIEYANLEFADTVYIMYGVAYDGIDDPMQISLYVWRAEDYVSEDTSLDSARAVLPCEGTVLLNGNQYAVFKYRECGAKNMGDEFITVAATAGVVSAPCKYSILEYALKAKDDPVHSENELLMNVVDAMLEFGAAAQNAFGYRTERPVNGEFTIVRLKNAHFADGTSKGVFVVGEEAEAFCKDEKIADWYDLGMKKLNTVSTNSFKMTVGSGNDVYLAIVLDRKTDMNLDFSDEGAEELIGELTGESLTLSKDGFGKSEGLVCSFVEGFTGSKWSVEKDGDEGCYLLLSSNRRPSFYTESTETVLNSVKKSGSFTLCVTLAKNGSASSPSFVLQLKNEAAPLELFTISNSVLSVNDTSVHELTESFYTLFLVYDISGGTVTVYNEDSLTPVTIKEIYDPNKKSLSEFFDSGELSLDGNATSAGDLRIKRISIYEGNIFAGDCS